MKQFYVFLILFVMFFSPTAHAQTTPRRIGIDPSDDVRLQKEVSFASPRIYIGDLLLQISTQTGVPLKAGNADRAAGTPIAISVAHLPLYKILNALCSLEGYRGATWNWERSGKSGAFSYTLKRSSAARHLAQRLHEEVQQSFEQEAKAALDRSRLSKDQAKQLGSTSWDDPKHLEAGSEYLRPGIRLFANFVSSDTQMQILRGERVPYSLSVAGLTDSAKADVNAIWERMGVWHIQLDPDREYTRAERLAAPRIRASKPSQIFFGLGQDLEMELPSLVITLPDSGGYDYIGEGLFKSGWRNRLLSGWSLNGDTHDPPSGFPDIKMTGKTKVPKLYSRFPKAGVMEQFARETGISYIGHLPENTQQRYTIDGFTPQTYLTWLASYPIEHMMNKWHEGILLFTYPRWFLKDSDRYTIPLDLLKQLREAEEADVYSFLPFRSLIEAAGKATNVEMEQMENEFPCFQFVQTRRPFFDWIVRHPERIDGLLSEQGIPCTGTLLDAVAAIPNAEFKKQFDLNKTLYVRVKIEDFTPVHAEVPLDRDVYIELLSRQGQEVAHDEFTYGHSEVAKSLPGVE